MKFLWKAKGTCPGNCHSPFSLPWTAPVPCNGMEAKLIAFMLLPSTTQYSKQVSKTWRGKKKDTPKN